MTNLHCWINDNEELQIEQDDGNPTVKAALCLPINEQTLKLILDAYLWAMNDGNDTWSFPGHIIITKEEGLEDE